jgi:hypothetical protein
MWEPLADAELNRAVELLNDGLSATDVAEEMGVSRATGLSPAQASDRAGIAGGVKNGVSHRFIPLSLERRDNIWPKGNTTNCIHFDFQHSLMIRPTIIPGIAGIIRL